MPLSPRQRPWVSRSLRHTLGLLLMAASVAAHAATPVPPVLPASPVPPVPSAPSSASAPMSTQLVKTGLYLISGGGSNSVLRFSAAGSLLVDGKAPGQYRALMSQVRRVSKLSDLPVRLMVVTDHHAHHAGNTAQFLAARVPVFAQENAAPRLPAAQPAEARQAPLMTYAEQRVLQFGGVEVHLLHFGSAQTDDATVVYFPDLKVIAVGDLYTQQAPEPDAAGGGSLVGWSAFLAQVMALDFDVAIPGAGPVIGKAELQAFKDKIDTLIAGAAAPADPARTDRR